MKNETDYEVNGNILEAIHNYRGDKKSWEFVSLVVIAYYKAQLSKMKMAEYLGLNIGEIDYFLKVNGVALTDSDFSISANKKNFELGIVREMLDSIMGKYPELHAGIEYHKEVDVWEIWHDCEENREDKEFGSFLGGLCREAFDKDFFNFYIDYNYKKDMEINSRHSPLTKSKK